MNAEDRKYVPLGEGVQPVRPVLESRRTAGRGQVRPFYEGLIAEYFPPVLRW